MPNFFDKEKYDSLWKFEILLEARIKTKKKNIAYYNSINLNSYNNILNSTHKKEQKQKKMVTEMEKRWICILELSKVLVYESHYDYIKNKYDGNSRLLFTYTDSLMYEIKTEDVYKDCSNDKEMFGFSNYSNKSVIS